MWARFIPTSFKPFIYFVLVIVVVVIVLVFRSWQNHPSNLLLKIHFKREICFSLLFSLCVCCAPLSHCLIKNECCLSHFVLFGFGLGAFAQRMCYVCVRHSFFVWPNEHTNTIKMYLNRWQNINLHINISVRLSAWTLSNGMCELGFALSSPLWWGSRWADYFFLFFVCFVIAFVSTWHGKNNRIGRLWLPAI